MALEKLLQDAYEQILTGCDLGDMSRGQWLEDYRRYQRMSKVVWQDGQGNIIITTVKPLAPKPSPVLASFSTEELQAELLRRIESEPVRLTATQVQTDTIAISNADRLNLNHKGGAYEEQKISKS